MTTTPTFSQRWIVALIAALAVLAGCERKYDQSTPDRTLYSLRAMATNGEIGRISELIHADDPNLELALARIGDLLQRMYELSITLREEYPDDVAKILAEVEQQATAAVADQDRRRGDDEVGQRYQQMMVDPTSFFTGEFDRLETVMIADDMAAVTYDGKPLFGVGVLMELRDDNKWYFDWPETIPWLNKGMPQTDAEWRIIHSILKSINNGLTWTEQAVAEGEFNSLDRVWREVMEQVAPPVVAGWFMYEQALKMRPEESVDEANDGGPADDAMRAAPTVKRDQDGVTVGLTVDDTKADDDGG